MKLYKLSQNENAVIRTSDNLHIPLAEGNRDYNEYKEWIDAGNQPDEADPIEIITPPPPEKPTA